MLRTYWLTAPICVCAILAGCASPDAGKTRAIVVHGSGAVTLPPDAYVLRITVSHRDMDVEAARKAASVTSGKIVEALKAFPTDRTKSHTTNLSVKPDREWVDGRWVFRGFEASQDFRVHITELDKAEQCVLEVLKERPYRADGEFVSSQEKGLWPKARERALLDAQKKAAQMAAVLDQQLGPPVSIKSLDEETDVLLFSGSNQMDDDAYAPEMFEDRLNWIPPAYVTVKAAVRVEFELRGR